jgi:hypothetical protein
MAPVIAVDAGSAVDPVHPRAAGQCDRISSGRRLRIEAMIQL